MDCIIESVLENARAKYGMICVLHLVAMVWVAHASVNYGACYRQPLTRGTRRAQHTVVLALGFAVGSVDYTSYIHTYI